MIETFILFKILIPTIIAFVIGMSITPLFAHFFYKYRLWKRSSRIDITNKGHFEMNHDFKNIHNPEETKTPRVGGIIVWVSVILTIFVTMLTTHFLSLGTTDFEFLSREQTLLPFLAMVAGAFLGLIDDFLQIFGNQYQLTIGIPRRTRIIFVLFMGALIGLWFYYRLGYTSIIFPFGIGELFLGFGFVLFTMFTILGLFSSSVIDGIDGLAGGVLAIIFGFYGLIGVIQSQFNIATFSFVIMGALLAFLWFNIPPARFYLGETGILALTLPLAIIIFLTNTIVEFLLIGMPLILTSASSLGQIIARRFFKVRLFKVAPFHHHLEAIGWSRPRITMRYWIFSFMCASVGIILVIIG